MTFRVIEGGRREEADDDCTDLLASKLRELSTPKRRVLLAQLRALWPMHKRSPEEHAFLLGFAKWIEENADD
jgi:hypothetical protein